MKPEELMITTSDVMVGDWVRITIEGQKYPAVVNSMKHYTEEIGVAYLAAPGDWEDGEGYDDIMPMKLTTAFLEGNGFKKFDFRDIEGQHQWSWWLDTLTSVTLWCRELNDNTEDGWMVRIESPLASCCLKVDYVHELQHVLRMCDIEKEFIIKETD